MYEMIGTVYHYQYLKAWKGRQEALAWLRERKPDSWSQSWSVRAGIALFAQDEYRLLWELFPELDRQSGHPSLWLYRTASLSLVPSLKQRYDTQVRDHYRTMGEVTHPYDLMARIMLDMTPFAPLQRLMADEKKRRCEAAYFLGVRALANNNLARANDWFRVSMETQLKNNAEYHWSKEILRHWWGKGKTLDQLKREDVTDLYR